MPCAHRHRDWSPRLWLGADSLALIRLLIRNRFAVHWSLVPSFVVDFLFTMPLTALGLLEKAVYGRRVRQTVIRQAPLFVIGHWRTGTTLLHEMLALDSRHSFPTNYECMAPGHFLLTGRWLPDWTSFVLPTRRPMDNMTLSWRSPQEDEFALALLGSRSPYHAIAFPNSHTRESAYLDFEGMPPAEIERWKSQFLLFLQRLTFRDARRLVLKSPPHTARIRILRELFPDAQFVHIVRDPYRTFVSTVHLWKVLYRQHGFQRPNFDRLEEQVFTTFLRLHRKLDLDRVQMAPSHFYELRYEDLIRDPIAQMRQLYETLRLGGFDDYRPQLERCLAGLKEYEVNRYEIPPDLRAKISSRWGEVIRRYGYDETGAVEGIA